MSKWNNTPGPWEYLGNNVENDAVIIVQGAEKIDLIGDDTALYEYKSEDEILGTSERVRVGDADGQLMAAAPELAEALEMARDYVQVLKTLLMNRHKQSSGYNNVPTFLIEDLNRIDKALAKAKGKQ